MAAEQPQEPQPQSNSPATEKQNGGRQRNRLALVVLLLALVGGTALRGVGVVGKRCLAHDEAITYLAATGHTAEFAQIVKRKEPPYGTWVKASEWKRLVRTEDAFCFRQIGKDLARYDIHPPMYFWLLHVWALIFGVHVWAAPTLNLALAVASTLALFGLARHTLRSSVAAAVVAFVWSVSPTVLPSTFIARHYELLGLVSILLVWQVIRCSDPGKRPGFAQYALLAVVTAVALLTHYHVSILGAGCVVFVIVRHLWRGWRWAVPAVIALALGLGLFALAHPGFDRSLKRGGARAQPATSKEVAQRKKNVIRRYTMFCSDMQVLDNRTRKRVRLALCIAVPVLTVKVVVGYFWHRRRKPDSRKAASLTGAYMLFFFFWTAAANIGLYLACVTPKHAMAAEHPSMVWPFCAFVPVVFLRSFRWIWPIGAVAFCLVVALAGMRQVRHAYLRDSRFVDVTPMLERTQRVIVTKATRGWLPRLVWHLPDDVHVYAADHGYVVRHYREWVGELERRNLYIGYSASPTLLKRFSKREGFRIERAPGIWGVGFAYMVFR